MRQSISVTRIDDSRLTKARSWGKIIVAKQMIFAPALPDMHPPFVAGFVFVVPGSPSGSRSESWRKSVAPTWHWSPLTEGRQPQYIVGQHPLTHACGNGVMWFCGCPPLHIRAKVGSLIA